LRSWMNSLSFNTHINILCKISFLTPLTSKPTEISLNIHQMAWYFYQTLQNNSETCCQNYVISALMVLEIQSNKAHRLRTTDYIHVKSNTPFFSKVVVKKTAFNVDDWEKLNFFKIHFFVISSAQFKNRGGTFLQNRILHIKKPRKPEFLA
jgi:hypothetical protein